jgi:hypothetical protein
MPVLLPVYVFAGYYLFYLPFDLLFKIRYTSKLPVFLKRLPGVGSKPGSSQFYLFSRFHHFTAEPQRLPIKLPVGAGVVDRVDGVEEPPEHGVGGHRRVQIVPLALQEIVVG